MSTDFESSVESLDHPVDNAPVRTLQHKGLTIEGWQNETNPTLSGQALPFTNYDYARSLDRF